MHRFLIVVSGCVFQSQTLPGCAFMYFYYIYELRPSTDQDLAWLLHTAGRN